MEIGRGGHDFNFPFGESQELRIADQVVAVRVVFGKGDEDAYIVQQGRMTKQLAHGGVRRVQSQLAGRCRKAPERVWSHGASELLQIGSSAPAEGRCLPAPTIPCGLFRAGSASGSPRECRFADCGCLPAGFRSPAPP